MSAFKNKTGKKVLCRHNAFGCRKAMERSELKDHEKECRCKPIKCPMLRGKCQWMGKMIKLKGHLVEMHNLQVHNKFRLNVKSLLRNQNPFEHAFILRSMKREFIFIFEKQLHGGENNKFLIAFSVVLIGTRVEARKYRSRVLIKGEEKRAMRVVTPQSVEYYDYGNKSIKVDSLTADNLHRYGNVEFSFKFFKC